MKKFLLIFALTIVAITSNAQTSPKGDLDNDGVVSVSDVMELVKIILYGDVPPSYLTCPDDHHPHMIDLGLPSGTKWACCNEGASKPEDFGGYYQFGDVSSAPSLDQIKELVNKCSYSWTTLNGVRGGRFTGQNGGTIFLPAAGGVVNFKLNDVGYRGSYWSSTPEDDDFFFNLQFDSSEAWWDSGWSGTSYFEYSVRPVR